jgi:homoserine dehydrogenase
MICLVWTWLGKYPLLNIYVVILARICGMNLNVSDVSVESLVPQNLESHDVRTFMSTYSSQDSYFEELLTEAVKKAHVLRYVGCFDPIGQSYCKLTSFPADHPFASLTGSDNMIIFTTRRFPSGLVIRGPGAGAEVTSFGVLSDLLRIRESLLGPL